MMDAVTPSNALVIVRQLAEDEQCCQFFAPVMAELRHHGLDTDDLRAIIQTELGEIHCQKTKATEKYYPATMSDYYTIWVEECGRFMFLKLLVADVGDGRLRLVVTSFKADIAHDI